MDANLLEVENAFLKKRVRELEEQIRIIDAENYEILGHYTDYLERLEKCGEDERKKELEMDQVRRENAILKAIRAPIDNISNIVGKFGECLTAAVRRRGARIVGNRRFKNIIDVLNHVTIVMNAFGAHHGVVVKYAIRLFPDQHHCSLCFAGGPETTRNPAICQICASTYHFNCIIGWFQSFPTCPTCAASYENIIL